MRSLEGEKESTTMANAKENAHTHFLAYARVGRLPRRGRRCNPQSAQNTAYGTGATAAAAKRDAKKWFAEDMKRGYPCEHGLKVIACTADLASKIDEFGGRAGFVLHEGVAVFTSVRCCVGR